MSLVGFECFHSSSILVDGKFVSCYKKKKKKKKKKSSVTCLLFVEG